MLLNGKVFFSALLFLYIVHGLNINFSLGYHSVIKDI